MGGEIAGKVFESARQRMSKRLRPQAAERLSEEAELPYIGWHLRRRPGGALALEVAWTRGLLTERSALTEL